MVNLKLLRSVTARASATIMIEDLVTIFPISFALPGNRVLTPLFLI
jgi:hypothetical protein